MSSILIHVPHASTHIPAEYLPSYLAPDLHEEILCMTDWYCDDLFECGQEMVVFPYSRLLCDVERFVVDSMEAMSRVGMGMAYTRCANGATLRHVPPELRAAIYSKFYNPHHAQLTESTEQKLAKYGRCLLVDGHSFHPTPLPYEFDQSPDRPDFCIGTDTFHTSSEQARFSVEFFCSRGYTVARNRPFSGTLVPMQFYHNDARVQSIMLEINRKLYMNDQAEKTAQYPKIKQLISEWISELESLF